MQVHPQLPSVPQVHPPVDNVQPPQLAKCTATDNVEVTVGDEKNGEKGRAPTFTPV
jgi:hypothetical protein